MPYYENRHKKSEITYDKGIKNGPYTTWHPNGKIAHVGDYVANSKIGIHTYFDETGNKIKEIWIESE